MALLTIPDETYAELSAQAAARQLSVEQYVLPLLAQAQPEPQLPPFDPSKVKPIPHEQEIRAAITRLNAEKAARSRKGDGAGSS